MRKYLCLLAIWSIAATPPPARFGTEVEVVNLLVSINQKGSQKHLTELDRHDFLVREDGISQDISFFTKERLPLRLSILIDASASMGAELPAARSAAMNFVQMLTDQDQAEIISFSNTPLVRQGFTSNKELLHKAIRSIKPQNETGLYRALHVAFHDLKKQRSKELRHYAVVLLTDGTDTVKDFTDEEILKEARKSEITVYPILLVTYVTPSEAQELSQHRQFLSVMAHDTGGRLYEVTELRKLDKAYRAITEELRTRYHIGYVPSNTRQDGTWRQVTVSTPNHPNLILRHRLGYWAQK